MKKYAVIVLGIIFILIISILYIFSGKNVNAPTTKEVKSKELCFVKFGQPNKDNFYDKYTLRLFLDGENAKGELKLFPFEKDSKVGNFEGTVGPVDKTMMARTAFLWWNTFSEGINVKEELKIIFGEGTANIGFGEMVNRGDGVYIYKDPTNIYYTLYLNDVSCSDLSERENVESYLKNNIATLSPDKAILGGTWYVVSIVLDLEKKSGIVTYEDGHLQEKKSFLYAVNENREVNNLIIN
jgi:hypothetical protein